jgi:zinc finger HIT domain-containing protein 1
VTAFLALLQRSTAYRCSRPLSLPTATRASGIGGVPVDLDWISRRVKRHLNDLERSNYTEPTSGPGAYGQGEDSEEAKGPSALGKDEDGECCTSKASARRGC